MTRVFNASTSESSFGETPIKGYQVAELACFSLLGADFNLTHDMIHAEVENRQMKLHSSSKYVQSNVAVPIIVDYTE